MIDVKQIVKTFIDGERETRVLKSVDFFAEAGDFVAIIGKSGAGKSTLLYQMSLLDHPTSGSISIDNKKVDSYSSEERTKFRLKELGYVFQDYALLPDLTAQENVALPLLMLGEDKKLAYQHAAQTLDQVGLGDKLGNLPSALSGGEQQRVSVARAIVHNPKVLFADEPTANLDNESSKRIIEIFKELNKKGQTIIMVTHEDEYARAAKRIVQLDDGRIVG